VDNLATQITLAANAIAFGIVMLQIERMRRAALQAGRIARGAARRAEQAVAIAQSVDDQIGEAITRLPKTRSKKTKPAGNAPATPPPQVTL
jgi:Flp pilus assembly protein TadG